MSAAHRGDAPPWLARFHATMDAIHREERVADRWRDRLIVEIAKEIEEERRCRNQGAEEEEP